MTRVITTIAELRSELGGRPVALVPTMGALHEGHLALVDRALELAETVVVSIFVNPLQFGPTEDLDKYPRTLDADVAALENRGVQYVFAPTVTEMYPNGDVETRVSAGVVGTLFDGASRPGHFDGMLTVVAKLLNAVQPAIAVFGQKDAQQVFLVQRMVRDLNLPVQIEVVDTVRANDGLALSSRNQYLSDAQRQAALTLSRALSAAVASASSPEAALTAAYATIDAVPDVALDYVALVNPATFLPVDAAYTGPATALIAARVGTTRLIDTARLTIGG
ncbi:pantoate--beta-alanine ligase [Diaminobutyricimonas sp. TR449]|uniref:pantoate--beta-alanine ligase n=1 Tax=Diaminobutyricimonas sp. TR449 TaxID=2708076 RepID=UPI0014242162|nr:pantoate--beta-alanine ligase [Diaminobutyricimonas sp. TR449]